MSVDDDCLKDLYPWLRDDIKPVFDTIDPKHLIKGPHSLKDFGSMSRNDLISKSAHEANREIENQIREAQESLSKQVDDYVLEFFGSVTNVLRLGHLFVLESTDIETEIDYPENPLSNDLKYHVSQRVRLRLKRPDELNPENSSGEKTEETKPFCNSCAGPYPLDDWPGNQYSGHWDTCPNRVYNPDYNSSQK